MIRIYFLENTMNDENLKMPEQVNDSLKEECPECLKQLSVLDIQEKERQRISRDLHDSSLQDLAHLIHQTELVSLYIDQDIVKAKLELASVEKGIRKVIDDIRNYIFNFRPMSFDDLGLKDSLENLFPTLNQDNKFVIKTDIDAILCNEETNSNSEIILITIYRIIQECFQNAVKHSDGTEIFVSLKENENYYNIVVHDNGKGLNLEEASMRKKHFGLSVIRERVFLLNGQINIENEDGTTITVQIPKK